MKYTVINGVVECVTQKQDEEQIDYKKLKELAIMVRDT